MPEQLQRKRSNCTKIGIHTEQLPSFKTTGTHWNEGIRIRISNCEWGGVRGQALALHGLVCSARNLTSGATTVMRRWGQWGTRLRTLSGNELTNTGITAEPKLLEHCQGDRSKTQGPGAELSFHRPQPGKSSPGCWPGLAKGSCRLVSAGCPRAAPHTARHLPRAQITASQTGRLGLCLGLLLE